MIAPTWRAQSHTDQSGSPGGRRLRYRGAKAVRGSRAFSTTADRHRHRHRHRHRRPFGVGLR